MPAAGAESPASNADTLAEAQIVESIEFWMRAYRRRWRQARGQELVDVVVDPAGPGAQRLDERSAFDLVRRFLGNAWFMAPFIFSSRGRQGASAQY